MFSMGTITLYFLVTPNAAMRIALRNSGAEIAELLAASFFLWTREVGHRSGWGDDDYELQVKLLFFPAFLRLTYPPSSGFVELVGDLTAITAAKFDERWVVERIDEVDSVESVEGMLTEQMLDGIPITEKPNVNEWLTSVRRTQVDKLRK